MKWYTDEDDTLFDALYKGEFPLQERQREIAEEHGFVLLQPFGKEENLLNELRNWNRDRSDMDEAITLHAFGTIVAEGYKAVDLDPPEWLAEKLRSIGREIEEKKRDYKLLEIKRLKAKLETIQDKQATSASVSKRIAKLEAQL